MSFVIRYVLATDHGYQCLRQVRFKEAARVPAAGNSLSAISWHLDADRKTLRRWLRAGAIPTGQQPRCRRLLDLYRDRLEHPWTEGCHNAARALLRKAGG